jgi:hypothetical protein
LQVLSHPATILYRMHIANLSQTYCQLIAGSALSRKKSTRKCSFS